MDYLVAVRALCEFTAKRGDLDLRFTPAPTALEGINGHAVVAGRRRAGYESEITLEGRYQRLRVRGRADGYDPTLNRLEEVKTFRGPLDGIRENHSALHWAQACVYGHLLCQQRELATLTVALVYFDIGSERETVLERHYSAAELATLFDSHCSAFLAWAIREQSHREARDAALKALSFVHAQFRPGQRQLSVAVYRAARDGTCLMAQAPTGIGKTLGTLFPLLKACPEAPLDKVFFLTAKSPGRALAMDALALLREHARTSGEDAAAPGAADDRAAPDPNAPPPAPMPEPALAPVMPGLPLRVVELVARDKACEHPDKACHGDSCPLAQGFYDRLPQARLAAWQSGDLNRAALRDIALAHTVCPYYLSQELVRWSDVVVADYNYYYDGSALLHALTLAHQWRVGVLVDEAHNLVERARDMYTAVLPQAGLQAAQAAARTGAPKDIGKALKAISRHWNTLASGQEKPYQVYDEPPQGLLRALQKAVGVITEQLASTAVLEDEALMRFYFEALHFTRLADQFGAHSIFDVTLAPAFHAARTGHQATLCLRNVVPAPFLAPRHASAQVTVLFSGTLSPAHFYRDMLGLPEDVRWIDVQAPFQAEQLKVRIVSHVSTRFRDRERSLHPIVDLIAAQYRERPGNYLGFFSSFEYLQNIVAAMSERHPDLPVWAQARGMSEQDRQAFLARFTLESSGVGFAVLGGAFSEGVDLPGARLIGAFIATLGLPQINEVNEQMRATMQARFGDGYAYMYLYPGLRKVVQAAGRVIRSEHDTGTVHLIDDRYRQQQIRALFPQWWQPSIHTAAN